MVRRLIAVALLLATTAVADEARTARLEKLCRVWTVAKYTHPAMLERDVDWDAALLRAIPRVREATTPAEVTAAIDDMLKAFGDPATRVIARRDAAKSVELLRQDGDVVILNAGPYLDANGASSLWPRRREMIEAIGKAGALVVDLTVTSGDEDAAEEIVEILPDLPLSTEALPAPSSWTTFQSGYAPQEGTTSGGYYSALLLLPAPPIAAAKSAPKRIAFITDGATPLPPVAVALWQAGKAAIVSSGAVSDAAGVRWVPLGDGSRAAIRNSEYASGGITADVVSVTPLDDALKLVRGMTPFATHVAASRATPSARAIVDAKYPELTAPDLPHRLLAAFRIWGVINYFYPYKPLIGDWDAVLREFIPRFEAAEGADAYETAIMEMTAHIDDGHTTPVPPSGVPKTLGPAILPFAVRRVEGEPVVVEKYVESAPVALGDVIVSVDGELLDARVRRLRKYLTASTDTARLARVTNAALRGPEKSVAEVGIRDASGAMRTVSVTRVTFPLPVPKTHEPYRLLDGNIGYADLRLLKTPQVDAMFDALMKTKAIIFDMRGYPNGTAWAIAPRINTRHAAVGAVFRRVEITGGPSQSDLGSAYSFEQPLPKTDKPIYAGRVVVLIDDRAISQAEHTCLFFEQAAGAKFVGTPTAGANGDVTSFVLPGGYLVYFTGHDVRHADGRQLQRVGIQPDVRVEPTIAGVRAGKDEVLDRAIAYVNGQ